jgi:hypothetical protein
MTSAHTHVDNKNVRRLVAASIVLALAGMVAAPALFAKIVYNTINPVATVADNGRRITVTGPISCSEFEGADLRVIVSQRSTGALAEGRTRINCTGEADTLQWTVEAQVGGKETFEAGPATAVALASTSEHGESTDAHQWLVEITLEAR